MDMKAYGDWPGHSNRVFCVKFNPMSPYILLSAGWDNTMQVYDLRIKGPVQSIYGPHICGEAIDFKNDVTVLTGSYRGDDAIQLWDLRTYKPYKCLLWEGGWVDPISEEEKQDMLLRGPLSPSKRRPHPAPFLYCAQFNKRKDTILVGGAGNNEVRVFDYESGNLMCNISEMERSVLSMDCANTQEAFCFGSSDSCLRVMDFVDSASYVESPTKVP